MSQDKKVVAETKLSEQEKLLKEKTAGFNESIAKTNKEKITKEILEGLSEDTDDSDSYDVESGAKTPKISRDGQVMQFSENQLLNRVISII
jgi:LysM repeat protein